MSACKDCKAKIVWARTEGGKRIALDPEPHSDGSIRLWETANGKLLAFVQRWLPNGPDGGYGYDAPKEAAREWFGHYIRHRCHA